MSHTLPGGGHCPGARPSFVLPGGGVCSVGTSGSSGGVAAPPPPAMEGSIVVPQTADAWTALFGVAPDALWLCQDTSGDVLPSIGDVPLVAIGSGHLYQQVVPGWERKFLGLTDNSTASWMDSTSTLLNVANGQSYCWLVYMAVQGNGSVTVVPLQANGPADCLGIVSNNTFRTTHATSGGSVTGAPSNINLVRGVIWYRNATTNVSGTIWNLGSGTAFHNESARTGLARGFGSTDGTLRSAAARYGLAAFFKGAKAETIAQASTLTTLGW